MYAHHLPMHLARALARPRLAAVLLAGLALLPSACRDQGPGSLINASPLLSSSTISSPASGSGPSLGAASGFAVLGGSTVTCTRASAVTGDVGVSPGTAITGFNPDCTLTGTIHAGDAIAGQAQSDLTIAYNKLAGLPCGTNITADLGGTTLPAGVYCTGSGIGVTGTVTLDGRGDPNATFVFQAGSTLTTAGNVVLIGGAQACNVYWQVGSSATIGTGSQWQGNIIALTSITLVADANLTGRALARNGAVTMDHNVVSLGECGAGGGHGNPPPCKEREDRVTGDGWISGKFGGKANFHVEGGNDSRKNALEGRLAYDDKGEKGKSDDIKVQGTAVTAYSILGPRSRRIEGTAKVNGKSGFTYRVDVTDNGGPGRGRKHTDGDDQFAISIWNASGALVYSNSGTLGGGNIELHRGHGRRCDNDLSRDWKIYNIDAATSKWDIDNAPAFSGGVAQFPFERFASTTSGSFAVYLLNKLNIDITGQTITANVAWDQGTFVTRGPAEDGAFVRLVFRDVGSGDFVSNDYWWSSVRVDLNGATSGTLTSALTDRTLWTNICGQPATDQTAHPGPNCTGGTDPAVSPFDGFTNAMKNVREIGLSFGRASRFASGVAVVGGPASFRLVGFTMTP